MTNHSILGNVLCPHCGSDDFQPVQSHTEFSADFDTLVLTSEFECADCGTFFCLSDKNPDEPKPLKF